VTAGLDHLVLAAPVLADAVAQFAELTGVEPVPGGNHPGLGTANYLVGLGGSAYLEIIGPDLAQPAPDRPRPFLVDRLDTPHVVTWAVRPDDLDATVATARARGYDPGEAVPMSRRAPSGDLLEWRLTTPDLERSDGLVPFLIDWGATPHPTSRNLPLTPLVSLRGRHPRPAAARAALAALDVHLDVSPGRPAGFTVVVDSARGPVTLP
jgi:hypothetical protein